MTIYLTSGGVSTAQVIYAGYSTLGDAQAKAAELAAATGVVIS